MDRLHIGTGEVSVVTTFRVGGDQAYFECGPYQTVGGRFENMVKYSEEFTVATWDKNGGSCSVTVNAVAAPDGTRPPTPSRR